VNPAARKANGASHGPVGSLRVVIPSSKAGHSGIHDPADAPGPGADGAPFVRRGSALPRLQRQDGKGSGDRIADGKVSNTESQLQQVLGDDSFMHLPPRQRELIMQAISGQLPPEYAAQIQQYYLNISRGRVMPK
jgi:hypothetical protein